MEVTAIIHTRNADRYLQEVIDRLGDFDEILVCDMESTDNTLEIARRNGCRIIHHEPCGFVEPARSYAMKEARFDWVFFVDADELVTRALVEYIRDFVKDPGKVKAVAIPRKNLFLDGWSESTYPDYQVRLLDRRKCDWPPTVHSNPVVNGKQISIPRKRLDMALIHKSPDVSAVLERMNRYTDLEVSRRINGKADGKGGKKGKRVKRPGLTSMILKPWWRFFKMYVLKGGFRQGVAGYLEAKNKSFYKLYTLAKIYEAEGKEKSGND